MADVKDFFLHNWLTTLSLDADFFTILHCFTSIWRCLSNDALVQTDLKICTVPAARLHLVLLSEGRYAFPNS